MPVDPEMAAKMAPGFNPVPLARRLLREARSGTLATLQQDGAPFASLVSIATDSDGTPLILVSGLASHTQHLERETRCSLLIGESGKGDPLAHPRLTLTMHGRKIDRESSEGERCRRRFLSRQPKAALYVDFPDFSFWRLDVGHAWLNGGFARAWDGPASEILLDVTQAGSLFDIEAEALEHMNTDHAESLSLYAEALGGARKGAWRATGIDPEGIDLMLREQGLRIVFPRMVRDGAGLRAVLAELARQARTAM